MLGRQKLSAIIDYYRERWRRYHVRMGRIACATVVLVAALGVYPMPLPVKALADTECSDVNFIFARGSGEATEEEGGASYLAWKNSILDATYDLDMTAKFYDLGTEAHGGYQYPAAAVSGNLQGYWNLVTAYFSAGTAAEFGESVEQGRGELIHYMLEEMQQCPNTKFVLGGYSQGAMILSKTLKQLYAPKIIYVATFGDPKIYLPEGKSEGWGVFESTQACRGMNLSPYREYVPDCHAYMGVLGSVRPYQPEDYAGKLGAWCNGKDIMCSSGMSIDDHTAYTAKGLYANAAQVIRNKLKAIYPQKMADTVEEKPNVHNLVFLFDATGSMRTWGTFYHSEAVYLAQAIMDGGGKVAFYTYADILEGNGNVTPPQEKCNFGCTIEDLDYLLENIESYGGGDAPESLLSAASFAMKMAEWTSGATKSIVVVTNAGYHPVDGDGTTLDDVVQQSLAIDPVNFYVLTLEDTAPEYAELAERTNGAVYEIRRGGNEEMLRRMSNEILYRPVAKLKQAEYSGEVGETFRFDASESYGFGENALRYDWDLDGDGVFELKQATASVEKAYATEFTGYIQVKVSDERGSSTMSARVEVNRHDLIAEPSQIKNLEAKKYGEDSYQVSFTTNADTVLLAVNDAILGRVELAEGKGKITLDDSFDNMRLDLVPYRDEVRGITVSMTLQKTDERPEDKLPDLSGMGLGDVDQPVDGSEGENQGSADGTDNSTDGNDNPKHPDSSGDNPPKLPETDNQPPKNPTEEKHPDQDHSANDKKPLVNTTQNVDTIVNQIMDIVKGNHVTALPKVPNTGVRSRPKSSLSVSD